MLSLNPSGKGVCSNFIHLSSVSNRLMFLNLTEEFSSYEIFSCDLGTFYILGIEILHKCQSFVN